MSYGLSNSATHIFTRLERLLTISDRGRIAGVCCLNQIKNRHFVICITLTSYRSLNFIITNNHTELQSPKGRGFCLLCWSTFYGTIQGYTKRGRIYWCAAFSTVYFAFCCRCCCCCVTPLCIKDTKYFHSIYNQNLHLQNQAKPTVA